MFGLELDEYYETPLIMQRFMVFILILTVVALHPLVTYALLYQSKSMNTEMRVGYLVLQLSQVLQDVFFCLLYQPYPLTPLPLMGCMGVLCEAKWLPPVKLLGLFGIFLNGSIFIYLSLLLRIQQALIPGQSSVQMTRRVEMLVNFCILACTVWVTNAFLCSTAEPENRADVIKKLNMSWIEQYTKHVVVFGQGLGDSGTLRDGIMKLAIYDIVMYSFMAFLIFLILRELKIHAKFESAKKRLCRTSIALLTELLVGGLLYIFPSLILIYSHLRPPLFIPDFAYFLMRIMFPICFSIQSIASSLIFLGYHQFGRMQFTVAFFLLLVGCALAAVQLEHRALPLELERKAWPGTCDGGDSTKTQKCLDTYFKGWGFDQKKDTAPLFIDYAKKLGTLMDQYGDDGVDIYCDYEVTLETCLGSLFNTPCINAESFELMYDNLQTIDCVDYAINLPQGAYSCKNRDLLKQYHVCYKETEVNNLADFGQCLATVQKELEGVVGSDRCIPWSNYSKCVTDVFVGQCGAGIRSFACNLIEFKLDIDVSACKKDLPDCSA